MRQSCIYDSGRGTESKKCCIAGSCGYDIRDRPDLLSISMKPMKIFFEEGSVLGHEQNVAKSFIRMHAHRKQ